MRSSMLKSLTIISLLSTSLFANSEIDEKVVSFETKKIQSLVKRNPNVTLNSMDLVLKKDLKSDGWFGYAFNLDLVAGGKNVNQKHYVFSNGKMMAPELINMKTKRSFKDVMYPTLSKKYFSKDHLIAGNPEAKHSLVLFSDPLCRICLDEVPFIIKNIMDNPKNVALYLYHMPLTMHPTAKTISKASMIAASQGIKNVDYRVYDINFGTLIDGYKETNHQKVLELFNQKFGTSITMEQINDKKWEDKLKHDMKMADDAFVNGTPTLFFDGEVDKRRDKYEDYLK